MSPSENHSVVNKLQSISVQVSLKKGEGDLVEYLKHTYGLRTRHGDLNTKNITEGRSCASRKRCYSWVKFLHQRAVLPLHPGRKRGGVDLQKQGWDVPEFSPAVPHAKGLCFSISASDHKQGHKQLN